MEIESKKILAFSRILITEKLIPFSARVEIFLAKGTTFISTLATKYIYISTSIWDRVAASYPFVVLVFSVCQAEWKQQEKKVKSSGWRQIGKLFTFFHAKRINFLNFDKLLAFFFDQPVSFSIIFFLVFLLFLHFVSDSHSSRIHSVYPSTASYGTENFISPHKNLKV